MPSDPHKPALSRSELKRATFGEPGRYAVTLECADDLTADERLMLEAWFETKVNLLQKRAPALSEAEEIRLQNEAAGL